MAKNACRGPRGVGRRLTIAVDANGSWDLEAAVGHLREMERYRVAWVEQPLPRGREQEIPLLAERSAIPLMADESLTTVEEATLLALQGGYRLFNLRISKLGGLSAAHRVARIAGESGVRLQVGCQVGESSLLSAAGRLLAATLPEVEALEGSYGTRLLESDVTDEPYEFGQGGAPLFRSRLVWASWWPWSASHRSSPGPSSYASGPAGKKQLPSFAEYPSRHPSGRCREGGSQNYLAGGGGSCCRC